MAETETHAESAAPSAAPRRRRTAARRKTASRKSPARRKKTSRARASAGGTLAGLLNDMAAKAGSAGKGLKTLSGQGAGAARRALRGAGAASRKTIARLTKEWERMDTRRRAQFVAALLAALAAASAPIVRGRLKK